MSLKKSNLCVVMLCAVPFCALADANWYGSTNLSIESADDGQGSFTKLKSNRTRVGFRGAETLISNLAVVYMFEFRINPIDDAKDNVTARNQYLGVKGSYGELVFGRNDTALKRSQGRLDLFNNLSGDMGKLFNKVGENRLTDTISYSTNRYNGFALLSTYVTKDDVDGESGYSLALMYGDPLLKTGNSYFSIATDKAIDNYDTVRISAYTQLNAVRFGALYQVQKTIEGEDKADGFVVNAAYLCGKNTFKIQYQRADFEQSDEPTGISIGVDHQINKNANIFAYYSGFNMDSSANEKAIGAGMEYKF
jgi:hypothetical protein